MRFHRVLALAGLLLVAVAPVAGAQSDDEELAGYIGMAGGAGASIKPIFPGLLPTGDAPFEGTMALSNASVKSGGIAFSQAALAWPGSAAANMGPLIGTAASQPVFTQVIPPWPASVQSDQDSGAKVQGAKPGPYMGADSKAGSALADAAASGGDLPGVLTIGNVSSVSRSFIEKGELITESVVVISGVSIAGGQAGFDSIRSVSRAVSNGTTATQEGSTVVTGATMGGQAVDVTEQGVTASDPVLGGIAQSGIEMKLAPASGSTNGGAADRVGGGVIVTIPNPLADANPQFVGSRFEITLAPTAVAALASPPFSFDDAIDSFDLGAAVESAASGGSFDSFASQVASLVPGGSGSTAGSPTGVSPSIDFEETSATLPPVKGVPIGLVLALASGGWFTATRIKKYGARFMTPEE